MQKYTIIGVDLAKQTFHAVTLQDQKVSHRKQFKRPQLLAFIAQHPRCHIAMEACAGAHYWAREFVKLGHQVSLLPPQHVKAYLRGQKNDFNDALAIAEACAHGAIRPVAIKSVEQQDEQAFYRIRRQLLGERTRLSNQLRGLLAEYGVIVQVGFAALRRRLPALLEDAENGLSGRFRALLQRQYERLLALQEELAWYEQQLKQQAAKDEDCQRLQTVPGFGPIVSSVFKAWLGDGTQFQRGREASAALGLVPKQFSSGGKARLGGITKRGDAYLRSLLVHGARAVVRYADKKDDPLSQWVTRLVNTRGKNKAIVALANKMVRIAWVVVVRQQNYCYRQHGVSEHKIAL